MSIWSADDVDVVDTHLHLWDPRRLHYDWFAGDPALDRPFLAEDLPAGRTGVRSAVFVEAGCHPDEGLEEVEWVETQAETSPLPIDAVVAFAPIERPVDRRRWLDAVAKRSRVRGVRRLLFREPDDVLLGSLLTEGLADVAARDLTFDLGVNWRQLTTAAEMVNRVPGLRVVLDHVGDPPVASGWNSLESRDWADGLGRLALLDQVHVKLSGLAPGTPSSAELGPAVAPFLRHALEAFGPDRCMVGSDWPRSTHSADDRGYEAWFDLVLNQTGLDRHERATVAATTARRFYGIS
jgi:L-fuconolactonase